MRGAVKTKRKLKRFMHLLVHLVVLTNNISKIFTSDIHDRLHDAIEVEATTVEYIPSWQYKQLVNDDAPT